MTHCGVCCTYGHLALSRCGSPYGLKVYLPGQQPDDQGRWYTANIVYKEVLIDD